MAFQYSRLSLRAEMTICPAPGIHKICLNIYRRKTRETRSQWKEKAWGERSSTKKIKKFAVASASNAQNDNCILKRQRFIASGCTVTCSININAVFSWINTNNKLGSWLDFLAFSGAMSKRRRRSRLVRTSSLSSAANLINCTFWMTSQWFKTMEKFSVFFFCGQEWLKKQVCVEPYTFVEFVFFVSLRALLEA